MPIKCSLIFLGIVISALAASAENKGPAFRVIAFYTAKNDQAHITFVHEANKWFPVQASRYNFQYDSTDNWSNLNTAYLKNYDIIVFLDTRPERKEHRDAFREFMQGGGGWLGFHFSAFALNDSEYPQNWDWYHNTFLGSGEYKSNTWRPTSAVLRTEDTTHPVMEGLGKKVTSSPNEWYRWRNDLRNNPDIQILLSVDSSSFPLGTGPKKEEIWHSGFYPVAWTNKKFRMLYVNMGHNDIDYENGTNKQLSSTFGNPIQDQLVINALFWLSKTHSKRQ